MNTLELEIVCDGSGEMINVCETQVAHVHCWNEQEILVNGVVKNWGGCSEPMTEAAHIERGWCHWCEVERLGGSIHNTEVIIYETRQRLNADSQDGSLGHSPFRHLPEMFLFGETEVVSHQEQTMRRWKTVEANRAKVRVGRKRERNNLN